MSRAREQFERLAGCDDDAIDLPEAALWIAAEEYPDLDVGAYLARLDALAEGAAASVRGAADLADVGALNHHLFVREGFHGDRSDYYDPRNSYLNDVLDRRCGIPITLAVVYLAVGRRLGLDVRGISFPGHFLVKCVGEGEIVVDAFEGEIVSREECQRRLDVAVGRSVPLQPELHLRAATPRQILIRMLSNLKQIFAGQRDLPRTLACCDRILLLAPDAPHELRDRASVYSAMECFAAAAADLDRFLAVEPDADDAPAVQRALERLRARVGPLH